MWRWLYCAAINENILLFTVYSGQLDCVATLIIYCYQQIQQLIPTADCKMKLDKDINLPLNHYQQKFSLNNGEDNKYKDHKLNLKLNLH